MGTSPRQTLRPMRVEGISENLGTRILGSIFEQGSKVNSQFRALRQGVFKGFGQKWPKGPFLVQVAPGGGLGA